MLEILCIESFSHEIITIFIRIFSCKSISLAPQIDSTVVNRIQRMIQLNTFTNSHNVYIWSD